MSDNKEPAERPTPDLSEDRLVLRTLKEHPGWKIIERYATYQQAEFQRAALAPLKSMEDVPVGEFKKGVAQGITEVLSLPDQLLEEIETELAAREARARQSQGEDDGTGSDDDC